MNAMNQTRSESDLLSFAALAAAVLRHARVIFWLPLGAGLVAIALSFLFSHYTAEARFAPSTSGSALQGLANVAAQFGFSVGTGDNLQSPDFYVALVESRALLTKTVQSTYRVPPSDVNGDTISGTLLELYGVKANTGAQSTLIAVDRLRGHLSTSADQATNIVTVRVTARWPQLAEQIARQILSLVNTFNVQQLQSQASAQRRFIEDRMVVAQQQLDSAEVQLRAFLERNRTYQSSPRLMFEAQRLQARLDFRQQVHTTLAQSYEQARIAEVRDTPVITVIDAPEESAYRRRHLLRNTLFGLFLGLGLALSWSLARDYLSQERIERPDDFGELSQLMDELRTRSVAVRFLARLRSGGKAR